MEFIRTVSLLQYMEDEGLAPSAEEEMKRRNVIGKLKEIVLEWAKRIAYRHRLPDFFIGVASATIMIYGSYGLGVHSHESDIDALCVGPGFSTMEEDFFIILRNMLNSRPEVSEIHCVKDAKVPLIRFKFDGISIDLPYARINKFYVPEDVDVFTPFILENIDEISWRSFSGVRVNRSILQLLPNLELLGYVGGVHLAVLAAVICRRHPDAWLCTLVSIFFETFASWTWPTPVLLSHGKVPTSFCPTERSLMPIQLPSSPNEYCHSNITKSTFSRIRKEFLRGHGLTKGVLSPNFHWKSLFEPFPYEYHYARFLKICLSSSHHHELGDWVGCIKSRFRCLIVKLEDLLGFCDPNPTEYVDPNLRAPNTVFFWGLKIARRHKVDLDAITEEFIRTINSDTGGPLGKIELSVVKASELHEMDPR